MQSGLHFSISKFADNPMFRNGMLVFIAAGLLLMPIFEDSAALAQPLIIRESRNYFKLMDYLAFIEAPDGALTIDDVTDESNRLRFEPRIGKNRSFGFSPSVFWARLQIENQSTENEWFALVRPSYLQTVDQIDLYLPQPDGGFRQYRDGECVPDAKTMIPEIHTPSFKIDLPPGQRQTLYFRIVDEGLIYLPFELYNQQSLLLYQKDFFIWLGLLGAFSFFFLYNLMIYWSLRDSVFIYFCLQLLSFPMGIFLLELNIILPELTVWWSNRIKELYPAYVFITWLLLAKSYFQINRQTPVLNLWIWTLLLMSLLGATAFFLLPYHWCLQTWAWQGIIVTLSTLVIAIIYRIKGFRARRYFLEGCSFAFLTHCIRTFDLLGIISIHFFENHWNLEAANSAIALLLVSFALIDRYNINRKELIAVQQSAVKSLQQAEKAKDEFLANTSHELRTPLSGIIGLTEDLLMRCKNNVTTGWQPQLMIIVHSARRLTTLIDDILDTTRIRQGKLQLAVKPVDFKSILKLVAALCRPLTDPEKVQIQTEASEEPLLVMADEDRLQQILINLIKNAIAFTPEGLIRITAEKEEKFLKVSVIDTGIGIAEEQQSVIFDRFTQLDGSMERASGGIGLGLTITRQLVELQGGRIAVKSSPGKGAHFCFTLPLAAEDIRISSGTARGERMDIAVAIPSPATLPVPSSHGSQKRDSAQILIVDDEQISLHVLHNHLTTSGYNVTSARDAFEAGALLKIKPFDLVVLDIMMPRKNGYAFCMDLRRDFDPTELPVIMLTARSRSEDIVKGFDCGVNDYLTKPVNRIELLTRIQTCLKLKYLADLLRENVQLKEEIIRRRRVEHQLNGVNHQLVGLLNLWETALLLVDEHNQILYFNQCAEELFGYPPHQIINHSLALLFGPQSDLIRQGGADIGRIRLGNSAFPSNHHRISARTAEDDPLDLEVIVTPIILNHHGVYALICREAFGKEETMQSDYDTIRNLARHHQKIQAMRGAFSKALTSLNQNGRQLRDELHQIDETITAAYEHLPEKELDLQYRKAIVALMTSALSCWHAGTGGDKLSLAEKSGIWRTYLDRSSYQTRTLDKYLNLDKLPQRPRWKDVLRTAHFVLQNSHTELAARKTLTNSLTQLKAVMRIKKLL